MLYLGLGLGVTSLLYFLALLCRLPLLIIAPVVVAAWVVLYRWMFREYEPQPETKRWPLVILAIALLLIGEKADGLAEKHGQWDAWAIWNMHARYLAEPEYWRNMFLNLKYAHPDYPLALPASLAFFTRISGGAELPVSYALHFLVMLCIPALIFTEAAKRNLLMASLALLLFVTNEQFITQGISQMADTLLAFFLLCAFVCFDYAKEQRQMIVFSSAFLGLCMWAKNEGVMLALVFVLFNMRAFVFEWKRVLLGAGLPILCLLIFKLGFAPANDLVERQSTETLAQLTDWARYQQIYDSLVQNLNLHYKELKYLMVFYLLYCLLRRKAPDRRLLIILTCMAGYFMVYVLSHQDLEWHLFTSYHRLLHQLMPATVYIFAYKLSGYWRSGGMRIVRFG